MSEGYLPPSKQDLLDLIAQIESLKIAFSGAHDIKVEMALFRPCDTYKEVRANHAKTKVIYITRTDQRETYWPDDWTMPERRADTIARLRERAEEL